MKDLFQELSLINWALAVLQNKTLKQQQQQQQQQQKSLKPTKKHTFFSNVAGDEAEKKTD